MRHGINIVFIIIFGYTLDREKRPGPDSVRP